jgi:hypothetical protein
VLLLASADSILMALQQRCPFMALTLRISSHPFFTSWDETF